jgi:hypothetical protein
MPITFGASVACFLARTGGAGAVILRASALPEPELLLLLGGGLVVLASLVRKLYPLGGAVAPKSMQVILWIAPEEVAEHLSAVDGD